MFSLILDLVILLIVGLCAFFGYKKGFVRSVCGILIFFVAIFAAVKFSGRLSAYLNESVFMDKVSAEVTSSIEKVIGKSVDSAKVDDLFKEKPSGFISLVERFGADMSELEEYYNENATGSDVSGMRLIAGFIARPVSNLVSKVISFIILFFGVLIVLTILKFILEAIFKLPVLSAVNKTFGLTIGIIKGALIAWMASIALVYLLGVLVMMRPQTFSPSILENTVIVRYLGNINIFNVIGLLIGI